MIKVIEKFQKNYFINGHFPFFQRGGAQSAITSIPTSRDYIAPDRFYIYKSASTSDSVERSTVAPSFYTKNSILFQCEFASSTDVLAIGQAIESINSIDLVLEAISFAVKYQTNSAQSVRVVIDYPSADDDYSTSTVIYDQTFNITNDSNWNTFLKENIINSLTGNANRGLRVECRFSDWAITGAVSTLYLGEFVLNKGNKTLDRFTGFGRDYQEELERCRGYFHKTYDKDTPPGTITNNGNHNEVKEGTGTALLFTSTHRMRRVPEVTLYSPDTGSSGVVRNVSAGSDESASAVDIGENMFSTVLGASNTSSQQYKYHWASNAEITDL